ncbi:uncharacterized protein K452DRAFT_153167 [Aplosporella prunicola CBS 121167]|uniref:AB hydrolase-1 domain-containing protein n=1 Tax=Aplosporella prunicola CBS 121167 TaxID=1176127 RepID=A0A6A6BIY4_9PEZI|nr:uncharacterized protein K452DRAFT_153167 [Aplosporella prunicola CBS 121167]KAF2144102.1 hypothetical protein K452DRAFT_153167 [Aplosporella prunicola CBS 121167]
MDGPVQLQTKPTASLYCRLILPSSTPCASLCVFLNGLTLPQASWRDTVDALRALRPGHDSLPAILTYDRYGQGASDHDPNDPPDAEKSGYGHDPRAAVDDLHQLLAQICREHIGSSLAQTTLIFVCNSIGCPLARLYVAQYGEANVAGLVFLDSMIANTDFVSLFPDPDSSDFDPTEALPAGVDVDGLRHARKMCQLIFHPTVPNKERLDRRNMRQLLPHAGSPQLKGVDGKGPHLTVVGHDPDVFAEQSQGTLTIPVALTTAYVEPAWKEYNQGLAQIVPDLSRVKGPLVAPKSGHFVQKDAPQFVAEIISDLLDRIQLDQQS